jgi:hypothetical protein
MGIGRFGFAGTIALAVMSLPLTPGEAQTTGKFVLGFFGDKAECESKLKQIQKTGDTLLRCLSFPAETPYRFVLWKISEGVGGKPPERINVLENERDCTRKAALNASEAAKSMADAQIIGKTYVRGTLTVQGEKVPMSWNFQCLPVGMNP